MHEKKMGEQLPDAMTHFCTHEGKLLVLLHHHFNTTFSFFILIYQTYIIKKVPTNPRKHPPPFPGSTGVRLKRFFFYLCAFFDLTSMTTMALRMCVNLICSFMCG